MGLFGENLRKRRIELGHSLRTLSSASGVGVSSIQRYETTDIIPPLETLMDLESVLHCNLINMAIYDIHEEWYRRATEQVGE